MNETTTLAGAARYLTSKGFKLGAPALHYRARKGIAPLPIQIGDRRVWRIADLDAFLAGKPTTPGREQRCPS